MFGEVEQLINLFENNKMDCLDFIDELKEQNNKLVENNENVSKLIIYCYFGFVTVGLIEDEEFKLSYIKLIIGDIFDHYVKHSTSYEKNQYFKLYENLFKGLNETMSYDNLLNLIINDAISVCKKQ